MKWKNYRTGDVLDFNSSNGIFHACNVSIEDERTESNHPYVVRTSQNNGIRGYISEDESKLNPANTISFAQDTAQMFYQSEPYFTGNKVKVLSAKGHALTENIATFLITCMNKAFSNFAWGSSYDTKLLQNVMLSLPVKIQSGLDFGLMAEIIGGGYDMSNIDTSSWKEFRLDELFEKIKTEKISGKANDFPTCKTGEYTIPLLTAGADNQGFARYAKRNQCPTILKNVISISANGANTGVTFYQKDEFAVLQDAYAIKLKDVKIPNEQVGLFLASCISKILHGNFSWTYKAGWERIKGMVIKLPVKESEEIDWEYMQERITELEQERITELEQYLIATGLNDYELTDEDKNILATKLMDGGALQSSTSVNGWLKEARSFKLDELFEKIQTKKIYGKANDFPVCKSVEYTIPLLTAGADNQGLARYGKRNQCLNILKNVISISANGANTGVTFYQSDEFAVLQDAYAIKLKGMEIPNKQVGLFLAACINKILHGNFSWTFKAGWERIKEMSINLPIKQSGEIDWEYMEKYIKATEKVVIRDVVDWKDEMIKKTKEVVGKTYKKDYFK